VTCEVVNLADGGTAIVCSRSRGNDWRGGGRCYICDAPATKVCDAPVEKGRTCDRPVCARHATPLGQGLDVCPAHKPEAQKVG
jgi:hypothetical protein